jgi:hypothetical protein
MLRFKSFNILVLKKSFASKRVLTLTSSINFSEYSEKMNLMCHLI